MILNHYEKKLRTEHVNIYNSRNHYCSNILYFSYEIVDSLFLSNYGKSISKSMNIKSPINRQHRIHIHML